MKDVEGDLWTFTEAPGLPHARRAVVVTTNGSVYAGKNVMGGGCAREAADKWPTLPRMYANLIIDHGNIVFAIPPDTLGPSPDVHKELPKEQPFWLILMPVKRFVEEHATLELVTRSAHQMEFLRRSLDLREIVVPRPGCGLGGLDYEEVRPGLEVIWPASAFKVITFARVRGIPSA